MVKRNAVDPGVAGQYHPRGVGGNPKGSYYSQLPRHARVRKKIEVSLSDQARAELEKLSEKLRPDLVRLEEELASHLEGVQVDVEGTRIPDSFKGKRELLHLRSVVGNRSATVESLILNSSALGMSDTARAELGLVAELAHGGDKRSAIEAIIRSAARRLLKPRTPSEALKAAAKSASLPPSPPDAPLTAKKRTGK